VQLDMKRKEDVYDLGYDSTWGGPHPIVPKGGSATGGESRIFAVYKAAQLYPEYVLTYQRKPHQAQAQAQAQTQAQTQGQAHAQAHAQAQARVQANSHTPKGQEQ
jgi:hypothetical protein